MYSYCRDLVKMIMLPVKLSFPMITVTHHKLFFFLVFALKAIAS